MTIELALLFALTVAVGLALVWLKSRNPVPDLTILRRPRPKEEQEPTEADNLVGPREVVVNNGTEEDHWAALAECMGMPPGTEVESIGEPFTVGHVIRFKKPPPPVRFNSDESGRT